MRSVTEPFNERLLFVDRKDRNYFGLRKIIC